MEKKWEDQRSGIIGLGENSFKKSYYPDLLSKIEELEKVRNNLETLFHSTSDGIVIHDVKGRIQFMNNRMKQMLELPDQLPEGITVLDFSTPHPENESILEIWQDVLSGTPVILDWSIRKIKSGHDIPVQVSINPTSWNGKEAIVGIVRDFTERLKYEKELEEAKNKAEESDRLKTLFLNNMSHEIRTPLNGMLGFSDLLGEPEVTEEQQQNYIRIIRNSGKQLLRIIDDILEISTLESMSIPVVEGPLCLNELLFEIFSIFKLQTNNKPVILQLTKGLSDRESIILTDRTKLHKILSNLVENALKYTPSGTVEIGYRQKGTKLAIYVKDTGIGIAPEYQQRIFERFTQENLEIAKNLGGLGLGLSIARENALLIGGDISLESEKEVGSTFTLEIEYRPTQSEKCRQGISDSNDHNHFTILIAEDEEVNFLYTETLIKLEIKTDVRILHARNGREAVNLCLGEEQIDIVFMDIKMPEMNGYEATKLIKEKMPHLKIIALTAYSTSSDRIRAQEAGCDLFLSKPVDRKKLVQILESEIKTVRSEN